MSSLKLALKKNEEETFKKYGIIHHYNCMDCGFKWESKHGVRGTYVYGEEGQSKCPKCLSPRLSTYGIDKWGNSAGGSIYAPENSIKKRGKKK